MAAEVTEIGQEVSEEPDVNNNYKANNNPESQTSLQSQKQPQQSKHSRNRSRSAKKHKSKNHIRGQSPSPRDRYAEPDKNENDNDNEFTARKQKSSSRGRENCRPEKFWDIEATTTLDQLKEKIGHKQRLRDGLSELHIVVQPVEVFASIYPEFADSYTREQLRGLEKEFFTVDLDQDGHLNNIEIKYWMEKYQQPINQRKVRSILSSFDGDKDGKLSFREFLLLCQHLGYQGCEDGHFDSNLNNEALSAYKELPVEISENRPKSAHRSKSRDRKYHSHHHHHQQKQHDHHQHVEHKNVKTDSEKEKQSQSKNSRLVHQKQEISINGENTGTGIRSASRAKGKIKPVVDYFEEKIAEVSTDFKKSSDLDDDLKERKARSKLPQMKSLADENNSQKVGGRIQIHQDESHLKVVEPLVKTERDCTSCSSRLIQDNSNYSPSQDQENVKEKFHTISNRTVIPVPPPLPPPTTYKDNEIKNIETVKIKSEPLSQKDEEENSIPIPPPMPQSNSDELDEFHVLSKVASSRTVTQVQSQSQDITSTNPNLQNQSKTNLSSKNQSRSHIDQYDNNNNHENSQSKENIENSDGVPDTEKEKENIHNQNQSETEIRNLTNPNSNMSLRLNEIFTKKDENVIPEFRYGPFQDHNRTPKGFVSRPPEKD